MRELDVIAKRVRSPMLVGPSRKRFVGEVGGRGVISIGRAASWGLPALVFACQASPKRPPVCGVFKAALLFVLVCLTTCLSTLRSASFTTPPQLVSP